MPVGLRQAGRSAIHPPASFAKLERPSEIPSITPSAYAGAPRLARNAGRIEVAASCPHSENRLARPMPSTPRVNQRFEGCDGDAETAALISLVPEMPHRPIFRLRTDRSGRQSSSIFYVFLLRC